jgi:putative ABC transport system permease protein
VYIAVFIKKALHLFIQPYIIIAAISSYASGYSLLHKNMNIIQIAWKNIFYKPLSALFTVLLFGLGVGLAVFLLLLNTQLQNNFEKNLAGIDLVVGAKGSPLQLILSGMFHIDSPTGNIKLQAAKPFLNPKHPFIKKAVPISLGDTYKSFRIVGTSSDFVPLYQGVLKEGVAFSHDFEVNIGASVAATLGLKLGATFKSSHGFVMDDDLVHSDASDFKVTGIFQPTGTVLDQLIITKTESIWAVHDHHEADEHSDQHPEHPSETTVTPDSLRQITALLLEFKGRNIQSLNMQRNINENTDMQAATPAIEITRLYTLLGVGAEALTWIANVILLVSGLSVFFSLLQSMKERKYELALMRVAGASRSKLLGLTVTEGILLSFLGGMLGILMGHAGMAVAAKFLESNYRYGFTGWVWLQEEAGLMLAVGCIGFLAALLPALQAYKTDISKILTK